MRRLLPLLPGGLALLLLSGALFGGLVPLTFDLYLYFYPYREMAARAFRAGEVPLWNPHLFLGVPFLGNLQASFFYPLNVLLYGLPAASQLTWGIWLHLALAGALTYAYLRRSLGTSPEASALGGVLFALGGTLGALAEHPNQLAASTWLPAVLLLLDLGWPWLPVLAAALGMVLLAGHGQAAYLVLAASAAYALLGPPARWRERSAGTVRPSVSRLALLAAGAAGGAALAAVQLLPALELAAHSQRAGGLPYWEAVSFSLSPRLLLQALLPPAEEGLFSEYVAYVGAAGLVLAALGLPLRRGRPAAVLTGLGLLLALGGYNPLYYLLFRIVPGFDLFRAPARWLLLAAWGLACLAALGWERLRRGELPQRLPLSPALVAALLAAGALLAVQSLPSVRTGLLWLVAAGAAAYALRQPPQRAAASLALLLLLELSWGWRYQGHSRLVPLAGYDDLRPAVAFLHSRPRPLRVLSFSELTWDPGDLAAHRRLWARFRPEEMVVAAKQKELLAPNLPMVWSLDSVDGYDGGILPTAAFYRLSLDLSGSPDRWPRLLDGRLWQQLRWPPVGALLDELAVDYLVVDKRHDLWHRDVYYDLSFQAAAPAEVSGWPGFPATALGVVFQEEVRLEVAGRTFQLRPGSDAVLVDERGAFHHALLSWAEPQEVAALRLVSGSVQGLTLVDERTGTFQPLAAAPAGTLRLVHSGDVKVYHNLDARPRLTPGRLLRYAPGRVEGAVSGPATVVLAEAHLPGWRAELDGRAVPVLPVEPLFLGVEVPAGEHHLVLTYRPRTFEQGWRLSAAALAALFVVGVGALVYNASPLTGIASGKAKG